MFPSRFNPFGRLGFPGLANPSAPPGLAADLAQSARVLADIAATLPRGLHTSEIFDMACNVGNEHSLAVHVAARQFFVHHRQFVRAARQCQRTGASRRRSTYEDFQGIATAFDCMDDRADAFSPGVGADSGGPDPDSPPHGGGSGSGIFEWALEQLLALMRTRKKRSITPEGLCFLGERGFPGMTTLLQDPEKLQDWFSAQVDVELRSVMREIEQENACEREAERRFGVGRFPSPAAGARHTDVRTSDHEKDDSRRRHALEAALHQERQRERIREADIRKKEEDTRQAIILDQEHDEDIKLAVRRQEDRQPSGT